MAELILLTVFGTSVWVGVDAPRHGLSWTWALGCLLLWILAFPWYLVERSKVQITTATQLVGAATAPPTALASWYRDPWNRAVYRYWDGQRWTGHTSSGA